MGNQRMVGLTFNGGFGDGFGKEKIMRLKYQVLLFDLSNASATFQAYINAA